MLNINTNLSSLIAQRSMKQSTNKLNQAIERLTTGFKINHAKDNAANYNIATNMTTKLGALQVAEDNCAMGLDLVTTASDTISLMLDKAQRLRSLCIQARNGTYATQSLEFINNEANSIISEINRIYSTAEYNGIFLFSDTTTTSQTVVSVEATPEVVTFALSRSTNEAKFIDDPITYTNEEIETLLASGNIVTLDNNVTTFSSGQKYLISNETQLARFASLVNSGQSGKDAIFILGANIDLGEYCDQEITNGNGGWTPIGNITNAFCGTFDGNGHVIKNLKIDREADEQGLFGTVASESEIKNIGIEGGYVNGNNNVGALVAELYSTVTNSYATAMVTGTGTVGGLVGYQENLGGASSIINSYATGNVTGTDSVGGLIGSTATSSIINSYATGNVTGTGSVGGLIGGSDSSITNSYATGSVTGTDSVGGLIGESNSSITNSYATGSVTGTGCYVGGLIGYCRSHWGEIISNNYATGSVIGTDYVGGLVGLFMPEEQRNSGYLRKNYAIGTASGTGNVGGLIGGFYRDYDRGVFAQNASVQSDEIATQMTENEIKATYTYEAMGFTEDMGWTIENGVPIIALKYTAQSSDEENSGVSGGTGDITDDDSINGNTGTGGGTNLGSGESSGTSNDFAIALQIGIYGNNSSQIGFDINLSFDLSSVLVDISSDEALVVVNSFIVQLGEQSAKLGSIQNRLTSVFEEISVQNENLAASLSTLQDADIANISSEYIRQRILQQASATLLATANQSASIALSLI